jgi:hypothetical protein
MSCAAAYTLAFLPALVWTGAERSVLLDAALVVAI